MSFTRTVSVGSKPKPDPEQPKGGRPRALCPQKYGRRARKVRWACDRRRVTKTKLAVGSNVSRAVGCCNSTVVEGLAPDGSYVSPCEIRIIGQTGVV